MKGPTPSPGTGLWSRVVWPLMAVPVMATGVFADLHEMGPLPLVGLFVSLSVLTFATIWGLWQESPSLREHAVRLGLGIPFALVVTMGWTLVSPAFGLVPPLLVVLLSPEVLAWYAARRRRRRAGRTVVAATRQTSARLLIDQELVDARFAEIVKQLEDVDRGTST